MPQALPLPSPAMVQRVYAHLGTIRHRSEWVEYRVEQHVNALGERLEALHRHFP
jgi:hypothetical protein